MALRTSYRPTIFRLHALRRMVHIFAKLGPPRFRRFVMKLIPNKDVRRTQEIVDIMDRTSVEIFERKKLALQQGDDSVLKQVGRGKDIMSILCVCQFRKSFQTSCTHLWDSESEHGGDRREPPSRVGTSWPNDVRPVADLWRILRSAFALEH
jgi:hypothetical protein